MDGPKTSSAAQCPEHRPHFDVFAVTGLVDEDLGTLLRKGGMRVGDVLVLTKPIGSGTLFAAHAQLAARGRWIQDALSSMLLSNRLASQCLRAHGATACTDVTGFGLLGHLVEMAQPSGVSAQIRLSALPLLDGAQECAAAGIVSSLHGANARARSALRNPEQFAHHARYPLLFDPQTAGGLLASVPPGKADACVAALHGLGYPHAAMIGVVLAQGDPALPVLLAD